MGFDISCITDKTKAYQMGKNLEEKAHQLHK